MTLSIPLDHMQVAFHHKTPGSSGEVVNTLGIDYSASTGTPQDVLDTVHGLWQSTVLQHLCDQTVYTGASALATTAGGPMSLEHESASNGFVSAACAPDSLAMLVQKRTGFAGRHNRGRLYLGGLPVTALHFANTNDWDATFTGPIQADFNSLRAGLVTASLLPVLFHQAPPVGSALPPTTITQFIVQTRCATQRGRMRD